MNNKTYSFITPWYLHEQSVRQYEPIDPSQLTNDKKPPVVTNWPCSDHHIILDTVNSAGYYLDPSEPPIARQAVVAHRHFEHQTPPALPPVNPLTIDKRFDCKQPYWSPECR